MTYDDKTSKNHSSDVPDRAGHAVSHVSTGAPASERRFRRLRLRQRFVPLLVVLVLLSSGGVVGLAYLGARANAIASAQARAAEDVRVERQLLADQGASVTMHDGQLFAGVDNAAIALNDDSTIVDRTHSLVNGYATIYQLEGASLVAIATNVPTGAGKSSQDSRALGDMISGSAFDALLGRCGAVDTATCHHKYSGIVTMHGVSYAAAYEPLTDANGAFVGALSVAIPLDSVLTPITQFTVMLLLVALLLALVAIVAGSWIFGTISDRVLGTLDAQLDAVADATTGLERLSRTQIEHAEHQTHTARQVSDEVRALNALTHALDEGQSELRESTGEIWAEMSQPGAAPDPTATLRWARQAAVASGRIGSAAEHARDLCQHIVTSMNHIIAEGNAASQRSREMETHAQELRGSVEQVEMALGERLSNRPHDGENNPLLRRMQPASQRLRRMLGTRAPRRSHVAQSTQDAAMGQQPASSQETGVAYGTATTTPRRLMGKRPHVSAAHPMRSSDRLKRAEQSSQQRISETGERQRVSEADARAAERPQTRIPQPSRPRGGAAPRDPQTANNLPNLPENSSSWRWINPNENR